MRLRMLAGVVTGVLAVVPAAGVWGQQAEWKLVWEDHFDRPEIGDGWFVRSGRAEIVGGRLFLTVAGATILVNQPFAADVKIEFVAEANPNAPPCDLSAALAGSNLRGYGHLLAFGGQNNQVNQIVGGGAHAEDRQPPLLIEHGKTYKLTAVKEGPHLAYFVNGRKIIEADVKEPLGGPGFDRVGVVTWNGMYADDVKVYERTTPAPGGPVVLAAMPAVGFAWTDRTLAYRGGDGLPVDVAKGVELYNQRRYSEALEVLANVIPPTLQSVVASAYVVGDVAYDERPGDQARLAQQAAEVSRRLPDDRQARDFALAAEWFRRITIFTRDGIACTRLVELGPEHNPFYHKAKLFAARFHHAAALEGGDPVRRKEALEMFAELRRIWPEHAALRAFGGERIVWGPELIHAESAGPAWARYLQEAFARQQAILTWWATVRQRPDGQLGGGWGDDVEILRTWVPAACVSTACEPAVAAIERLAQGVWQHVLQDGYSGEIGDVEHSAEPSADALPTMILLRYGRPRWVEYNLRSAKTIRERFMGVNDQGFLHFKSAEFGSEGVNTHPRAGGDTGYHARAMRHFVWLAWYGVPEARDVFAQWCDGWRDVTMSRIGAKPPGFAPASVWFPSGSIAPPGGEPWYDPLWNYYGFSGLPRMIHHSFLTAHVLSSDRRFLDPVQTMMDLATIGPRRPGNTSRPPDDPDNLLADVAHHPDADLTAVYRWLTGERVYDEYTLRSCSAWQRYLMDGDLSAWAGSARLLAEGLRHNWELRTSEVLQTDRAGLEGAAEVCGAYTGAVCGFTDSRAPTLSVTYCTPDLNFAAVVSESTPVRLRVRLYNFNPSAMRMGLRPWRLVPGVYVLNAGEPVPGEHPFQQRYAWGPAGEVEHRCRGTPIWVDVPARKEWLVDLRLRKAVDRPALLPDLAIDGEDARDQGSGRPLIVSVHNIGEAPAGPFDVVVEIQVGDTDVREAARVRVDGLPAIRNFEPVLRPVELPTPELGVTYRIVVDPDDAVPELNEDNNQVLRAAP